MSNYNLVNLGKFTDLKDKESVFGKKHNSNKKTFKLHSPTLLFSFRNDKWWDYSPHKGISIKLPNKE